MMGRFNWKTGFTLAELLIALAILGVIATFVIPKVLNGQQDSKRRAVFRETIAALNQSLYDGYLRGQLLNASAEYDFGNYYRDGINYVQFCDQALTESCYVNAACVDTPGGANGFIMHNGASTCGLKPSTASKRENFWVDWNGPNQGSNTEGDDQLRLTVCFDQGCTGGYRAGTVSPYNGATSIALYEEIFSH